MEVRAWKNENPPKWPDPVAATNSGTTFSYEEMNKQMSLGRGGTYTIVCGDEGYIGYRPTGG